MLKSFRTASVAFCALFLSAAELKADTVYTDRASFLANTSGTTTIDFSTLVVPANAQFTTYLFNGPTVGSVSFAVSANLPTPANPQILFALAPNTIFNAENEGLLASLSQVSTPLPMDLEIFTSAGATAVGFDYFTNNPGLTFTLSDGETQTASSTSGFIGFTSSSFNTSVILTSSAETAITIGDFTYGSAAVTTAVPLPSAAWGGLLLGCVAIIGGLRRKTPKCVSASDAAFCLRPPIPPETSQRA